MVRFWQCLCVCLYIVVLAGSLNADCVNVDHLFGPNANGVNADCSHSFLGRMLTPLQA